MRVSTGKVVSGKVVVEGEPLDEGAIVTVLTPEGGETFELNAEAEQMLLAAIGEADRGEVVEGDDVLHKLDKNR
jgi:hypothetical protein